MKLRLELVALGALAITGCNSRVDKQANLLSGNISYSQVNEMILKPNCLVCHGGSQPPLLSSYPLVKANLEAIRMAVMVTRRMPKRAALPPEQMALLERWIDDGAPERPEIAPPPPVDGRPMVHWTELHDKVIGPKCAACHFDKNPGNLSNLDDLDTFRSVIGPTLFLSVVNATMPPPPKGTPDGAANPNQLTRPEKDMLAHWAVDGMLK